MDDDQTEGALQRTWTGLYVPEGYRGMEEPSLAGLTSTHYEAQLSGLKLFAEHPDVRCIWEFRPDEGELLGLSLEPGTSLVQNTDCWIVSPFVPGRLVIHSPIALRAGTFRFVVSHTVLFDSNLYDLVVRFVERRSRLSEKEQRSIVNLISAIVVRGYDYQMIPYVLESFSKNSTGDSYEYALRAMRAVLTLHTMDKRQFLASGAIELDPETLEGYAEYFGTSDLSEIARRQLEPYQQKTDLPLLIKLNLLLLTKMVFIRKVALARRGFDAQWAAFDEFMFERLGIMLGTMRNLSIYYFKGKLDRWLTVQQASKPETALAKITNCAWDLYLGSLHQEILAQSPVEAPALCHFCTRERGLAQVLGSGLLGMLKVHANGGYMPYTVTNLDGIRETIGPTAYESLAKADHRAAAFLADREAGKVMRVDIHALDQILSEVLSELSSRLEGTGQSSGQ